MHKCMEMRTGCKYTLAAWITILIVAALLTITGCSMFDIDGNGRFDPIAYLENADITVAWVDEDGQQYNVAVDKLGQKLVGQFIQAKTGYLFEVQDDGGVTVTDPNGVKLTIGRKVE